MRILYYDYTGTHNALIAAAIHLHYLPRHRKAIASEFYKLPSYREDSIRNVKEPRFLGRDSNGNSIYCFGTGLEEKIMIRAIHSLLNLYNIDSDDYLLIDTSKPLGLMTKFGAYFTYAKTTSKVGHILMETAIERNYLKLVSLVEDTEAYLKSV